MNVTMGAAIATAIVSPCTCTHPAFCKKFSLHSHLFPNCPNTTWRVSLCTILLPSLTYDSNAHPLDEHNPIIFLAFLSLHYLEDFSLTVPQRILQIPISDRLLRLQFFLLSSHSQWQDMDADGNSRVRTTSLNRIRRTRAPQIGPTDIQPVENVEEAVHVHRTRRSRQLCFTNAVHRNSQMLKAYSY
eukprot:TRINITY_DN10297_c0_g2_i2.p1 TRINITY_DN10297_c0_g2~~TRINITY_DN10297_c0_g2_i2.p1  ORF type:complete len:187 (-),score=15.97 TRINITY_DN10297_c0_g2_i2:309-869(-)